MTKADFDKSVAEVAALSHEYGNDPQDFKEHARQLRKVQFDLAEVPAEYVQYDKTADKFVSHPAKLVDVQPSLVDHGAPGQKLSQTSVLKALGHVNFGKGHGTVPVSGDINPGNQPRKNYFRLLWDKKKEDK